MPIMEAPLIIKALPGFVEGKDAARDPEGMTGMVKRGGGKHGHQEE